MSDTIYHLCMTQTVAMEFPEPDVVKHAGNFMILMNINISVDVSSVTLKYGSTAGYLYTILTPWGTKSLHLYLYLLSLIES